MKSAIERMYGGVLLLNLTNVFVTLAPLLGMRVASITGALVLLCALYLCYRWPVTARVMSEKKILFAVFVVLVWPGLTMLYALDMSWRLLAVHLTLAINFVGSAVFVRVHGWEAFRRIAATAIAVSAVGLAASAANPEWFSAMAEVTGSRGDYGERAFGFFMQPNTAASSIIILGTMWVADVRGRALFYYAACYVCILAMVVVTGSRGGLATAAAFGIALALLHRQRAVGVGIGGEWIQRMLRSVGIAAVVAGIGVAVLVAALPLLPSATLDFYFRRVQSLARLTSAAAIASDGSGAHRIRSQSQYIELIAKRPVTGYGLGAHEEFIRRGRLYLSSHNSLLETAIQFGVPYVVALFVLFRNARLRWRNAFGTDVRIGNFPTVLGMTVLASSLFVGTLLHSRVLFVILGALTGVEWPSLRAVQLSADRGTAPRGEGVFAIGDRQDTGISVRCL